jgi:hypothetical protein
VADLASRLRALGVSEQRIFNLGLASRAPEVTAKATDDELTIAHEYDQHKSAGRHFEAARIRASKPRELANGKEALAAIDQWIDGAGIKAKHGQK